MYTPQTLQLLLLSNGFISWVLNMASSDSQINKPQPGHPKRAELLDVNINTGVNVNINTGMQSFFKVPQTFTKSHSKNAEKKKTL